MIPAEDAAGVAAGSWPREPATELRPGIVGPDAAAGFAIHAESESSTVPVEWAPHAHPQHELVWVRGGTLTARVGDRLITVSAGYGLWLPAGTVHAGRLTAHVELSSAFFSPDRSPIAFDGPTSVVLTPLLEALLAHLEQRDLPDAARARAEGVVFDVLEPSALPFALDLPGDARIDAIARALLADPGDERSLDEWAAELGTSGRTIARAFRTSTGLSFAQWRQVLRIHAALGLLAEGRDVRAVSELLGYAQPSTFIAAFRRVMGRTPGAFAVPASARPLS